MPALETDRAILKHHQERAPTWTNSVQRTVNADPEGQTGYGHQSSECVVICHTRRHAGRPPTPSHASHVADLTLVNFVIASHMTIMFCQRCAVGRFKPAPVVTQHSQCLSPCHYIDGSRPASHPCFGSVVFH